MDSRNRRDGKYIEHIGYYNPKPKDIEYSIDEERAKYWLNQGAVPTEAVSALFRRAGILKRIHEEKYGNQPEESLSNTEKKEKVSEETKQ
jgi:small subunit ribosomal protein S16